ncbi:MAG: DUF3788 family protein [Acidobacteriota bacterium]
MTLSAFDDQTHSPESNELMAILGPSAQMWKQLISAVAKNYPPIEAAWNFGGIKFGWSLRLKRKDRIILYLIPQNDQFLVGVVLGEKAVKAAYQCSLPASILELIENTRFYAEGRGIRLPVTTPEDLVIIEKLAAAKMA